MDTPTLPPSSQPPQLEYDYRRNVAMDLVLTILLCGLWNMVVQYHHCETLNAILRTEKYSFWKMVIFSILTCGVYLIYHEYEKAKDFQQISGRTGDSDPILAVVLAIFGLNFIYDAILQTKINEYLDRFPG
jgi:hypothetical protein